MAGKRVLNSIQFRRNGRRVGRREKALWFPGQSASGTAVIAIISTRLGWPQDVEAQGSSISPGWRLARFRLRAASCLCRIGSALRSDWTFTILPPAMTTDRQGKLGLWTARAMRAHRRREFRDCQRFIPRPLQHLLCSKHAGAPRPQLRCYWDHGACGGAPWELGAIVHFSRSCRAQGIARRGRGGHAPRGL